MRGIPRAAPVDIVREVVHNALHALWGVGVGLGALEAVLEHVQELLEAGLVHRVDEAELRHHKVQDAPPRGNAPVVLPRLRDLQLRLLGAAQLLRDFFARGFGVGQHIDEACVVQHVALGLAAGDGADLGLVGGGGGGMHQKGKDLRGGHKGG